MKKRLRLASWFIGIPGLLMLSATFLGAQPTCNYYYNSTPSWIQGYGAVCAYTGAGCRECYGAGGGTVCVDAGGPGGCLDYPYY